jgi:hypothetical protein
LQGAIVKFESAEDIHSSVHKLLKLKGDIKLIVDSVGGHASSKHTEAQHRLVDRHFEEIETSFGKALQEFVDAGWNPVAVADIYVADFFMRYALRVNFKDRLDKISTDDLAMGIKAVSEMSINCWTGDALRHLLKNEYPAIDWDNYIRN